MRIRCSCGANLADVTYSEANPDFVASKLHVAARPGVDQDDHHMRPGIGVTMDRTYTWTCTKCRDAHGRPVRRRWRRTAVRIAAAWSDAWAAPDAPYGKARGVVRVTLDVDL